MPTAAEMCSGMCSCRHLLPGIQGPCCLRLSYLSQRTVGNLSPGELQSAAQLWAYSASRQKGTWGIQLRPGVLLAGTCITDRAHCSRSADANVHLHPARAPKIVPHSANAVWTAKQVPCSEKALTMLHHSALWLRISIGVRCLMCVCRSAHLGHPGHRVFPVIGIAWQAAPRDGVANGQVGGAAMLVVITACRLLHAAPDTVWCSACSWTRMEMLTGSAAKQEIGKASCKELNKFPRCCCHKSKVSSHSKMAVRHLLIWLELKLPPRQNAW